VPTQIPTLVPTTVPTQGPTPGPTAVPTQIPTLVPTTVPTSMPTHRPTEVPSPRPTLQPTAMPTPGPTAISTQVPSPRPTEPAPYQVLSSTAHIHIRSQLGGGRMAFAFLPPPTPQPRTGPSKPLSPALLKRLSEARQPYVVDIFPLQSPVEEAALLAKLDAAWQRYKGLGFRRLRLTGLVKTGEAGGEGLSRARAVRMSELLSRKGFKGEFVIWVQGVEGNQKGVRIEVLR
jgi:hypothetical protein